jgi:hypothetical protein
MFPPNHNLQGDPFIDNDNAPGNKYLDMMIVYPSAQGPIPTTEWESLRAGYNDVRYLTTLFDLINEIAPYHPDLANTIQKEVNKNLAKYNNPTISKTPSASDFQNTRSLIISKILQIQTATGMGQ